MAAVSVSRGSRAPSVLVRSVLPLLVLGGCQDDAGTAKLEPGCAAGLDLDADGVCDRDTVDWSADATLTPGEDRANIYGLADDDWMTARTAGMDHIFHWPVAASRLLVPYAPMIDVFTDPDDEVVRNAMDSAVGFSSEAGLYARMGLSAFPDSAGTPGSPYWAPPPPGQGPGDPMGATLVDTEDGVGLTFSCAACHVGTLFGQPVVGLTSKRPRPNALFHFARSALSQIDGDTFQALTSATDGEVRMFEEAVDALAAVGTQEPVTLGLDTSLAQVAGSLARRSPDAVASFDAALEHSPAPLVLDDVIADSKPMVWWTLKHKTRWLADGSIVSGNPILTNFLWNEIGRGVDLEALGAWLESEDGVRITDELTVAVFASEAPRWTDFFPADSIDEARAQDGQALFADHCADCHGTYDKGWDEGATDPSARLATTRVSYHPQTPRVDVGTSPGRADGMVDLERLNDLDISVWMGTVVDASEPGYVPPPLDGIWARYPYLHNGSVPTLCDLLRPPDERPAFFVQGPADDPEAHFDADCVGYPVGDAIPDDWMADTEAHYTVGAPGRSAEGHDQMLDGIGDAERLALVEFLKTL